MVQKACTLVITDVKWKIFCLLRRRLIYIFGEDLYSSKGLTLHHKAGLCHRNDRTSQLLRHCHFRSEA